MAETITFEELKNFAVNLAEKLGTLKPDLEELAANDAKGLLYLRVFGKGGSKDIDNNKLKPYTPAYARRRAAKGRQASSVDLQVTGGLKNSIQVGRKGKQPVLGFIGGKHAGTKLTNAELAAALEGEYGNDIFKLNEKEAATVVKAAANYIEKNLKL